MKIYALITARGGSKGIPQKNIRTICGKPLIAHTILAAQNCTLITRSFVTTEDSEVKRVSQECGAEIIHRPAELATDTTLSQDVVRHALESLRATEDLPEYFVLLQPTSPLRTALHLTECLQAFLHSNFQSCMSVTDVDHHPYKYLCIENGQLLPFYQQEGLDKPRQLLPKVYRQNGAIYLLRSQDFLKYSSFFVEPAMPYYMKPDESIDIDTEIDFFLAEQFMAKHHVSEVKKATLYE